MTRPIESVVAEAQQRLESSGRLDVAAFISAYPEHATELKELLPVMLDLHREKQWQQAEQQSRTFALDLFAQFTAGQAPAAAPVTAPPEAEATLGDLLSQERAQAGLSLADQAKRSGLPVQALEQLIRDSTPLSLLRDNTALKQLAVRASAPFGALVKEVRRLLSLQALSGANSAAVFTRDRDTSTDEERQALLDKVREAALKPPEEKK